MKKFLLLSFFIVLSTYCYSQKTENLPLISVLDFEANDVSEAEARLFTDFLSGHIVDSGKYNVIDRGQREVILQELAFSLTGCTDESCQLEIGKMLQAEQIIVGSLGKFGSRYIINIKLIDVETNLTLKNASEKYNSTDEMLDKSSELISSLLGIVDDNAAEISGNHEKPAVETGSIVKTESSPLPNPEPEKKAEKKPFPVIAAAMLAGGLSLSGFGGYMIYDAVSFNQNTLIPAWDAYDEAVSGSDFNTLYSAYTAGQTELNSKALTAALCTGGGLILTTISIILLANNTPADNNNDVKTAFIYPSVSYGDALSFSLSIRY